MKNKLAREVLTKKLQELGGIAFARWLIEVQGGKEKKTAEAMEFFTNMFEGKLTKEENEYLEPYLKDMREIVKSLEELSK
jgi:hypothetical protein